MGHNSRTEGCFPSNHAKIFEVILIIGFLLANILLIINLILLFWCIKLSYPLLIIKIRLIALNAICLILSIILRVWRSDDSVFNTKLLSSYCVAIINLVLVIINLLSSITEEVLFSFVIYILTFDLNDKKNYAVVYILDSMDEDSTKEEIISECKIWYNNCEKAFKKAKEYIDKSKIFVDIMNKDFEDKLFKDLKKDEKEKKIKMDCFKF